MDVYEVSFIDAKGATIGNCQLVRLVSELPPIVRGGMALSNCVRILLTPEDNPKDALVLWMRPGLLVLG